MFSVYLNHLVRFFSGRHIIYFFAPSLHSLLAAVDRIDAVVDQVHAALRDHAFLDEDVTIEISQWTSKPARIVQAPDTTDDNYDEPYVPKGYCRIAFLSSFGEPDGNEGEIIPIKKVKRDRIAFSKQNFKRFLKENMIRENWPGAPMVVKPEVAARLGISMEIPPAIQDLYRRRLEGPDYRPPRTLNAEPGFPTMYPIDDTQLWKLIKSDPTFLQKHGNLPWLLNAIEVDDAPTMGPRPEGRKVPGGSVLVPQGVIGDLLYVWNFLIVFW